MPVKKKVLKIDGDRLFGIQSNENESSHEITRCLAELNKTIYTVHEKTLKLLFKKTYQDFLERFEKFLNLDKPEHIYLSGFHLDNIDPILNRYLERNICKSLTFERSFRYNGWNELSSINEISINASSIESLSVLCDLNEKLLDNILKIVKSDDNNLECLKIARMDGVVAEQIPKLSNAIAHKNCKINSLTLSSNFFNAKSLQELSKLLVNANKKNISNINLDLIDLFDRGNPDDIYLSSCFENTSLSYKNLSIINSYITTRDINILSKAIENEDLRVETLNLKRYGEVMQYNVNVGSLINIIAQDNNDIRKSYIPKELNIYGYEIKEEHLVDLKAILKNKGSKLKKLGITLDNNSNILDPILSILEGTEMSPSLNVTINTKTKISGKNLTRISNLLDKKPLQINSLISNRDMSLGKSYYGGSIKTVNKINKKSERNEILQEKFEDKGEIEVMNENASNFFQLWMQVVSEGKLDNENINKDVARLVVNFMDPIHAQQFLPYFKKPLKPSYLNNIDQKAVKKLTTIKKNKLSRKKKPINNTKNTRDKQFNDMQINAASLVVVDPIEPLPFASFFTEARNVFTEGSDDGSIGSSSQSSLLLDGVPLGNNSLSDDGNGVTVFKEPPQKKIKLNDDGDLKPAAMSRDQLLAQRKEGRGGRTAATFDDIRRANNGEKFNSSSISLIDPVTFKVVSQEQYSNLGFASSAKAYRRNSSSSESENSINNIRR